MLTPAKIAANFANAQSSTGPRTEEGKATSSKNAVRHGLFSGDFIRPGEESGYVSLGDSLLRELAPVGTLEETLVDEMRRAIWRLRRCGAVEAELAIPIEQPLDPDDAIPDPMSIDGWDRGNIQKSVDRARSQAHRLLHKCTAELRRLQTDRQSNRAFGVEEPGLADARSVRMANLTSAFSTKTEFAQRTHAADSATPRNAPCRCGSGLKYKRCCGKAAPAMLFAA